MTEQPKAPKLTSSFALLDVKGGRNALFKAIGYTYHRSVPIPVTITGFIVGAWGIDDGKSRKFEIDVRKVETR